MKLTAGFDNSTVGCAIEFHATFLATGLTSAVLHLRSCWQGGSSACLTPCRRSHKNVRLRLHHQRHSKLLTSCVSPCPLNAVSRRGRSANDKFPPMHD